MEDDKKRVDEGWKNRVDQEKEQNTKGEEPGGAAGAQRPPFPEASFAVLISSFATQVYIFLGEIDNPMTGNRERDLDQAKFTIDLLEVLRDKTKGNLTEDETKLIDGLLFDLRMRYVRVSGG